MANKPNNIHTKYFIFSINSMLIHMHCGQNRSLSINKVAN